MKTAILIARVILGLIFTVFGLNAFLQFMPQMQMEGMAGKFVGALMQTGYFFPFMKSMEVICGLLILAGIFMPLALLILLPININILLFHLFLGLEGMPMAVFMIVIHIFLIWAHRTHYKGLLVMK